jgi:hypothetical protein
VVEDDATGQLEVLLLVLLSVLVLVLLRLRLFRELLESSRDTSRASPCCCCSLPAGADGFTLRARSTPPDVRDATDALSPD